VLVVRRVSLQQQQQPMQQMLTQNFAVQNWNSTSHYQPYTQPAAAVDPGWHAVVSMSFLSDRFFMVGVWNRADHIYFHYGRPMQ